ncbi:MAG: RNA 2'-phosphotransferase, partial [Planctomycetota bacterium]|nr:RNA 2'-phosphotransferase [Planctomycetota bacterium]
MQQELLERLTRSLAYMLRHQPEEFDLELDEEGFADVEDVLDALSDRLDVDLEEEDLMEAVASGGGKRYQLDDGMVRALYGHSFHVEAGETTRPPELLYLGVGSRDAERAEDNGLRAGRRAYLHLALSADDAREMGRRIARDYAVITVNALDAWEAGCAFYDRGSLFLADPIDREYLEVGEIQHDGIVRERSRRGRGGGRDERRGSGGRRGGGRDSHRSQERDERPARDERP